MVENHPFSNHLYRLQFLQHNRLTTLRADTAREVVDLFTVRERGAWAASNQLRSMASLEFGNVMRRSAPLRMTMEKVVRIYCWRTRCFDCSAPAALRTGFGEVAGWAAHRPPIQPPHPKKNESRSDEQSKKRVRQQYRSFVRAYDKHTKWERQDIPAPPK